MKRHRVIIHSFTGKEIYSRSFWTKRGALKYATFMCSPLYDVSYSRGTQQTLISKHSIPTDYLNQEEHEPN